MTRENRWGRSSLGALADVVEWREWHRLLAQRDVAEARAAAAAAAAPSAADDERRAAAAASDAGDVRYWRWDGQHLVRYTVWSVGGGDVGEHATRDEQRTEAAHCDEPRCVW